MALDLGRVTPVPPRTLATEGDVQAREPLLLGGTRCHTLVAKTPDGPTAHVWYLSADDGLPRLWETTHELGGGDGIRKRMTLRRYGARSEGLPALDLQEQFPGYTEVAAEAWSAPEDGARGVDAGLYTSLAPGIDALRERFNADQEHVRAVGMFAPS